MPGVETPLHREPFKAEAPSEVLYELKKRKCRRQKTKKKRRETQVSKSEK